MNIHIIEHQPRRDASALRALAAWLIRFAPLVAPDPPDGIVLNVTGCQRLYHGERRLVNALANQLAWLGIHGRIACASTVGCAWAAARYSGQERCIVAHHATRETLAPLPVAALRLDEDIVDALRELNIEHIGELDDLPRLELAARFDPLLLRRLDQALGTVDETIDPIRPVDRPTIQRTFAGPVLQLESVMQTVRAMLDELADQLQQREAGARAIDLHIERVDAQPVQLRVNLSHPSRSAAHLWSLFRPRIETVHLGFGIERLDMSAASVSQLPHQQLQYADTADAAGNDPARMERAFGELVDTLHQRLGSRRIIRMQPVESHVPERAFVPKPLIESVGHARSAAITLSDRPSLLWSRPEPARVLAMTPDGPVTWLRWRGAEHRIVRSIGPERITEPWWCHEPQSHANSIGCGGVAAMPAIIQAARDYFKVQDDAGRWLWLCRRCDSGQWFVHGEWV